MSMSFCLGERTSDLMSLGFSIMLVPGNPTEMARDCFAEMVFGKVGPLPWPKIGQDDRAAIMHSSGTTGTTKGIVQTHGNLIAMFELFVRFEASHYKYPAEENVNLAVLPMFPIYGLALFAAGLLTMGTTVVVMQRLDPKKAIRAIDRFKVTHFPVIPPILSALTRAKVKGGQNSSLRSLKQVSSGAAPMNNRYVQEFMWNFLHVDFIQVMLCFFFCIAKRNVHRIKICLRLNTGIRHDRVSCSGDERVQHWEDTAARFAQIVGSKYGGEGGQLEDSIVLAAEKARELLLRGPAIMKGH